MVSSRANRGAAVVEDGILTVDLAAAVEQGHLLTGVGGADAVLHALDDGGPAALEQRDPGGVEAALEGDLHAIRFELHLALDQARLREHAPRETLVVGMRDAQVVVQGDESLQKHDGEDEEIAAVHPRSVAGYPPWGAWVDHGKRWGYRWTMPIPLETLAAAQSARITVDELDLSGGLAGHARFLPRAVLLSACRPLGAPNSEDDLKRHAALKTSLGQAGFRFYPARLEWLGSIQDAVLVQGCPRAKAVKLAYKRKQWCHWELSAKGVSVVYSGVNSRQK